MRPLTREEAREIDRRAMQEFAIPGLLLMEHAAQGIAAVVRERLAGLRGPVALVCGPGNNGGDGYATARLLAHAGVPVRLVATVGDDAYGEGTDAAAQVAMARRLALPFAGPEALDEAVLVVDALFGTGLSRRVEAPFSDWIARIGACGAPVVSVDTPSGLDADDGTVHGCCVRAAATATMVAPKRGFGRGEGPAHVGDVVVVDIGAPRSLVEEVAGRPEG